VTRLSPSLAESDSELARHVLEAAPGAARAEAELCRRFGPRVRSYGLRHLRDRDAANELCQRVLLLVLEKLRSREVREADSIASFVLGTAQRVAQTLRRGEARLEPLSQAQEPWHEPTPPRLLDVKRVAHCMEELGERERAVVALTFFDELNATELATAIGVTAGNARVMRHRALQTLRDCFERAAGVA
jgi:RNA polymerase sigma-70 factor (ECF subfamily)